MINYGSIQGTTSMKFPTPVKRTISGKQLLKMLRTKRRDRKRYKMRRDETCPFCDSGLKFKHCACYLNRNKINK